MLVNNEFPSLNECARLHAPPTLAMYALRYNARGIKTHTRSLVVKLSCFLIGTKYSRISNSKQICKGLKHGCKL